VTAVKHLAKANILAMNAILKHRPDAMFIQSESSEYFHAANPAALAAARARNSERFLTLDLNYEHPVDSEVYEFLMDNGMTREEYAFFLNQKLKRHCIMGNDYYWTNEHLVAADGHTGPSGEIYGYGIITWQYFQRYRLPVMHTETNLWQGPEGQEAAKWLRKQWANVLQARALGVPVVGFTWYSLTDQIDWDTALREKNGHVNPVGLYDLDRNIRPVGKEYRQLIKEWSEFLPTETICLTLPIALPE
jgi:beta-glucosidase/6-phospho-beta-glucosidase/beta-galactosidase